MVPREHSYYVTKYLQLLSLDGIITGEFQLFLCIYLYCPGFLLVGLFVLAARASLWDLSSLTRD